MRPCSICKINEADKTGSHIVPSFLLKRIYNEAGELGRDKGIMFEIGKVETKYAFERSVSPEALKEMFGDISDENIEQNLENIKQYIFDNIFCSDCEKKLALIESEYAKSLDVINQGEYTNPIHQNVSYLFWCSIVFRISLVKSGRFKIKVKEEEFLRKLLSQYLKLDLKTIVRTEIVSNNSSIIFQYKLIRCPNYHQYHPSCMFLNPFIKLPYLMMLDEYVLAAYFKVPNGKEVKYSFVGLESTLNVSPTNTLGNTERITSVSVENYKSANIKVIGLLTKQKLQFLINATNEISRKFLNCSKMPSILLKDIFEMMAYDNDTPLAERYEITHLSKCTFAVFKKHGLLLQQ